MAVTDQTVHLTKKFWKQNRLVSLSHPWIGPKFLTLDQILRSYSQKTVFQFIALRKFPQKLKIFETAAAKLLDFFDFFFFAASNYISQGRMSENFALLSILWAILGYGVWFSPPPRAAGISPWAGIHRVKWLLEAETHIPPLVLTLWARLPLLEPLFVL